VHRTRNLLIDIAVVVILVTHAAAFVVIRQHRTRNDGEARAIAEWMHDNGEDRVAWPEDLRGTVPALLSAGVTPVLVDDAQVASQQLAVNDTGVVVTRHGNRLADVTGETFEAGDLTAHLVDLDAAAATPLEVGDFVGQNVARPYRYAPIRNSLRLTPDEPFTTELTLDPGSYRLAVEAFSPQRGRDLVVTVATKPRQRENIRLRPVVQAPIVVPFTVGPNDAQPVLVRLAVAGDGAAQAFVHQWTVQRTSGA
jgi:hypothetical protein